jgi:hypothetical protein
MLRPRSVSLFLALTISACGKGPEGTGPGAAGSTRERPAPAPPASPAREDYPARSAARPDGTPCEALTAQGCLWSKQCVLEAPARGADPFYVCRPAQGPCEGGVAAADPGFASDCRGRGVCSVRAAQCFCPNARTEVAPAAGSSEELLAMTMCACGGGDGQRCVPRK